MRRPATIDPGTCFPAGVVIHELPRSGHHRRFLLKRSCGCETPVFWTNLKIAGVCKACDAANGLRARASALGKRQSLRRQTRNCAGRAAALRKVGIEEPGSYLFEVSFTFNEEPCSIETLDDLQRALTADSFDHISTRRALDAGEAA